jgi:3',5'-cyclic-AMP phosphodiesterase
MGKDEEKRLGAAINRRGLLKCMAWSGAGVVWTLHGGVPRSLGLVGDAAAAVRPADGLTFVQISDSHIGFGKPPNPDARTTLSEAIDKIGAMATRPAFIVHTGDISHLSKPAEFDDADQIIRGGGLRVRTIPGEHDVLDDEAGKLYRERYGKGTKGDGWYSFEEGGVHFVALVNVMSLKGGGLGSLGGEQLEWLENDVEGLSSSTPIVVLAHAPLWAIYPEWGWGTEDGARALSYLKRFGSVTVLNGHIHQVMQKVEGNVAFHTAMSTAFPQPAPGTARSPGPLKVPADQLRRLLGVRTVAYRSGDAALATIDAPLDAGG